MRYPEVLSRVWLQLMCCMLKVSEIEKMLLENLNAIVAVQVRRSNNTNAMGEGERRGESDNGKKV